MNTQPTALDAHLARAAAIHIKLAGLQQLEPPQVSRRLVGLSQTRLV